MTRASRFLFTAILAAVLTAIGYLELICATAISAPGIFLLALTAWLAGLLACGLGKFNVFVLGASLVLPFAISGVAVAGTSTADSVKVLATAGAAYACSIAGRIMGRSVAAKREKNS